MASSSNPRPSQEIPDKIMKAIKHKEAEIEQLTHEWKEMMDRKAAHLKRIQLEEKEIQRMKGDIQDRESRIRREKEDIRHIMQEFAILQDKVNDKQNWIDETKAIFE